MKLGLGVAAVSDVSLGDSACEAKAMGQSFNQEPKAFPLFLLLAGM
jgi:hypothetical protein